MKMEVTKICVCLDLSLCSEIDIWVVVIVDGAWVWQVTKRVETSESQWKSWNWRSEGDLMLNGAYFTASGAGASASYARASSLGAKSSSMVASITAGAGALPCRRGRQC